MPLRVAHLWAYFGRLSERYVGEEILGLLRSDVETDILSFRPAVRSIQAPRYEPLRSRVRHLEATSRPWLDVVLSVPAVLLRPWVLATGHEAFPQMGWRKVAEWSRDVARKVRLAKILASTGADVLHAQHGHLAWMALPVVRRAGLPLVVSLRGQDVELLHRLSGDRINELCEVPSRFLARCEEMARRLRDLGLPENRVVVHPTGAVVGEIAWHERAEPEPDEPVIMLSVGRLVEKKGMADAISALAASRVASRRAVLRIVGDGPEGPALRTLARQRGIESHVEFTGALPHPQVLKEMARAHVFVLASHATADGDREGVPNVIKEAAASGLPVVSTTHSGIPEVVTHGVSGLLAEEGNVQSLSACLDEILKLSPRWGEMGRSGRKIVEDVYDIERLTPRLIDIYRAVVSEASGA